MWVSVLIARTTESAVGMTWSALVNDAAQGATNIAITFCEQASGVRVAINSAAIHFVVFGYPTHVFPADKSLVYFVLILVATNLAVRLMEFEAGTAHGRWGGFLLLGRRFLSRP